MKVKEKVNEVKRCDLRESFCTTYYEIRKVKDQVDRYDCHCCDIEHRFLHCEALKILLGSALLAMKIYVHETVDPLVDVQEDGTGQKNHRKEGVHCDFALLDHRYLTAPLLFPGVTVDSKKAP